MEKVNKITEQFGDVKVYRKDLGDEKVKKELKEQIKANIKN